MCLYIKNIACHFIFLRDYDYNHGRHLGGGGGGGGRGGGGLPPPDIVSHGISDVSPGPVVQGYLTMLNTLKRKQTNKLSKVFLQC